MEQNNNEELALLLMNGAPICPNRGMPASCWLETVIGKPAASF